MTNYNVPIKVFTQQDLIDAECFDLKKIVDICEDAFLCYAHGDVIFPDKVSVVFNQETQDRINCLPAAIVPERVYGMKWVSVFPENPKVHNCPNLSAVILLSELQTGYPIALMEGTMCSNLRTAAVGALGAKYLARKESEIIGFIGAGEQAKSHFLAMMEVLPNIKKCMVSSRTSASEEKFIEQMKKFYPEVEFVACDSNYKKAVLDADVIVTAISGQEKILQADWIKEGAFYCHVAGLEDDFKVALKASKIVCDNWEVVKHRTQTISQMYQQGLLTDASIYADLHEIIDGKKVGRQDNKEFIYFNSVGMSFVDVRLAKWMYDKAVSKGKGMSINLREKSMFDI